MGAVLQKARTPAKDDAVRDATGGPHADVGEVGLGNDEELVYRLDRQSSEAIGSGETLVCTTDITQVGAGQPFKKEGFGKNLLRDGIAGLRSKSSFTCACGLDIVKDCEGESPLPAHARHDQARSRIVFGTKASMLGKAERLHEIGVLGVWLESIKVK